MMFAVRSEAVEPGPDDEVLVRRASLGDRAAFGGLYERYARLVHGILLARVPPSDAEDLVQDVFLSALRKLHMLRAPGAFRGWLGAIARNRAIEYHRTAKERTELADSTAAARPSQSTRHEALMALEAIRRLPEAYRETLILRLVEGLTGPEIARVTGLTHSSVRVNLCRGMALLREQLGGGAK